MKKIFGLVFLFCVLALSGRQNKVMARPRIQGSKNFGIFSDGEFKIPAHNFSAGKKIYVHLIISGSGEEEKVIRLLDAGKNEIDRVSPNQEGNNPYTYTATFIAPAKDGTYYIDAKIKDGEGFTFAGQQNISVSSQAESRVSVSEENSSPKITTFFSKVIEFLRKFLFGLTNKEG